MRGNSRYYGANAVSGACASSWGLLALFKSRLGDWEGDTVVSAGHKGGLLTHVERKSMLTKIVKLPRTTAKATHKATVRRLKPIRRFVATITYDNGKEFASHQQTAKALKAKVYFATPYHAWERGLNENTNGLIRDFFPRVQTSLRCLMPRLLRSSVCSTQDHAKSLGFRSPQEVFQALSSA